MSQQISRCPAHVLKEYSKWGILIDAKRCTCLTSISQLGEITLKHYKSRDIPYELGFKGGHTLQITFCFLNESNSKKNPRNWTVEIYWRSWDGAVVAQWWSRSPPTYLARVRILDPVSQVDVGSLVGSKWSWWEHSDEKNMNKLVESSLMESYSVLYKLRHSVILFLW